MIALESSVQMNGKVKEDAFKVNILALLKVNKDGLTITEVSEKLGIHYVTASKYLAVLKAEQKLDCRAIGMAKMFRIKNGNGLVESESPEFAEPSEISKLLKRLEG